MNERIGKGKLRPSSSLYALQMQTTVGHGRNNMITAALLLH